MKNALRGGSDTIEQFVDLMEAQRTFWGSSDGKAQGNEAVMPKFLNDILLKHN